MGSTTNKATRSIFIEFIFKQTKKLRQRFLFFLPSRPRNDSRPSGFFAPRCTTPAIISISSTHLRILIFAPEDKYRFCFRRSISHNDTVLSRGGKKGVKSARCSDESSSCIVMCNVQRDAMNFGRWGYQKAYGSWGGIKDCAVYVNFHGSKRQSETVFGRRIHYSSASSDRASRVCYT